MYPYYSQDMEGELLFLNCKNWTQMTENEHGGSASSLIKKAHTFLGWWSRIRMVESVMFSLEGVRLFFYLCLFVGWLVVVVRHQVYCV